ncbi:hypothetical protein RSAG8_03532, partial [Rhizoctonia solani AG-8 WAC10335]
MTGTIVAAESLRKAHAQQSYAQNLGLDDVEHEFYGIIIDASVASAFEPKVTEETPALDSFGDLLKVRSNIPTGVVMLVRVWDQLTLPHTTDE